MEVLHLPDNIKVHFAGAEVMNQFIAVELLGVRYFLYTAFPFVERKVFKTPRSPIMPLQYQLNPTVDIPKFVAEKSIHCIQDSGLFTLMFGSMAGKKDEQLINKWYDGLVEFTLEHGQNVTCVEVDCQKVLGVDKAWEFRERIKRDLPNNRIINVFHLEDGKKGLDRLIEFSDYIAISVPELRKNNRKQYVVDLAKYIKKRKPTIDIHLLGCTELALLHECKFCTSSDSTTYTASKRYGFLNRKHISKLDTKKVKDYFGDDKWKVVAEINNEMNTNTLLITIENCKVKYFSSCGNQDYYAEIK